MENSTFKMSDDQKYNALWELLNAEGYYAICSVYDDYALAYDYQNGKYERVYYTKDDGTDSVTINNKETCYILDVTETEYNALKALRALNGDSYELIDEKFSTIPQLEEKISETNTKVEELNNEISTLTTERDEKISAKELELTSANESYSALKAQYDELVASNETLTSDYQALVAYKKNIEDAEKASIIDSYSDSLSVEVLEQFRTEQDQYTAEELDMRLTYAAKKAHPEVFQKQSQPAYVPKENEPKSGIEQVLSRYENKH
ncbi:MAG: hypothetical protein LIR46_10555 [Bacteroidota bacterium]|nr:hypothetical protein [Bacteroidota bacterium]